MTDVLSLGPVLDLIERWQQTYAIESWSDANAEAVRAVVSALEAVDISALRQLAEQHAAQLREQVPEFRKHHFNVTADTMEAAADFLCAPRRDDTT